MPLTFLDSSQLYYILTEVAFYLIVIFVVLGIVFGFVAMFKIRKINKRLNTIEQKLDINNNAQNLNAKSTSTLNDKTIELLTTITQNVAKDTISKKRKEIYLSLLDKINALKQESEQNVAHYLNNNSVLVKVKGASKDERKTAKTKV